MNALTASIWFGLPISSPMSARLLEERLVERSRAGRLEQGLDATDGPRVLAGDLVGQGHGVARGRSETRVARPRATASSPDTIRPVNASSLATSSPTSRGRVCRPVMSGRIPQRISSTDSRASGATIRRSAPRAIWMPPPSATPCTAAMTGTGSSVHVYTAC